MRVVLKPIVNKPEYAAQIEPELIAYFSEAIFQPLLDLLEAAGIEPKKRDQAKGRMPSLANAVEDPLTRALRTGRLWYADDVFSGELSASISKRLRALGATFDAKSRTFRLPIARMPMDLRSAVSAAVSRSAAIHSDVIHTLELMQDTVATAKLGLHLQKAVDKIAAGLQSQMQKTTMALDSVTVQMQIDPAMRAVITSQLTENLDLSIKQFASEKIPELRRMVEKNAAAGGRADRLGRIIEAQYGVSKRKAAFWARQETSLLTSKYHEEQSKRLGSKRYVWRTSRDEIVRHDHRRLEGTVQLWSNPPVVDLATGRRAHPGEDYECRCLALPIVELADVSILP